MRVNTKLLSNGEYTIEMDNSIIRRGLIFQSVKYNKNDDPMPYYIEIVRHFIKDDEMFLGHYRTDGINLTNEERMKYKKQISEYYQNNGKYESLDERIVEKCRAKMQQEYLTAGRLPINDDVYVILPKIFHYYLETILFCPKITWDMFTQSYRDYMKHGAEGYVLNGFTDFLFSYSDSGVFSITFNPSLYDYNMISQDIHGILSK